MKELEYKKFIKRYDKYKNNNLPTPFWDDERQILEYVYFEKDNNNESKLEVNYKLSEALGNIAFTGFYYSFTDKHMTLNKDGKPKKSLVVEHTHAHSFEEVVRALYDSPESFKISKEEEQFYSNQELEYLRRVQKYLLFIGLKDLTTKKAFKDRYKNKVQLKYANAFIYKFNDEALNNILSGKRDYRVIDWYPEYNGEKMYSPNEYQALIVDKDDNFKMFVEFTYEEVKKYKDIKKIYKREDLTDNSLLIINHFKILEIFN